MCAMWQPMIVVKPGEKIKITPADRHEKQWGRFVNMKCSVCLSRKRVKEAAVGPKVQCSARRCRKPLHVTIDFFLPREGGSVGVGWRESPFLVVSKPTFAN